MLILFFAGITGNNKPNDFNCVGNIYNNSTPECSCVLIGSQYVLVPAHALVNSKIKLDTIAAAHIIAYVHYNDTLASTSSIQIQLNGKMYDCEKIIFYPEFVTDSLKGECDIAIIKLKTAVTDVTPANINTNYNEMHDKAVATGYSSTTNYKVQKLIDSLGGYHLDNTPIMLVCKFRNHSLNNIKDWPKNDILFDQTADGWHLAGIGGGVEYTVETGKDVQMEGMSWTRVSAFADWIKKTIAEN